MSFYNNDIAFLFAACGGVFEGPNTVRETVSEAVAGKETFGAHQGDLVKEGLSHEDGSLAKKLAGKYEGKMNAGKDLTGTELYTLANANAEAAINESAAKIEKELTGLGVKGDVKKVAQALAKDAAGAELSVYDRYLLKHNGVAQAYTYLHSVDDSVTSFVSSVLSMTDKKSVSKRKKRIGEISGSHAELISQIIKKELGADMDLHGYELWIDGSGIEHIEYRHGKNGKADQSMKNITDYGRIPWVVENADSGSLLRKDNGEVDYDVTHKNSDGSPSPQIKLSKQIGNTEFFVVECVPDSNAKRLYIKSAYKRKSSNGQELNLEQNSSQQPTSEMLLDGITTNTMVSQKSTDVNSKNSLSPDGISIAPPVDGYNVRGEDVMIAPKVDKDAEIDIAPPVEAEPEISIAPSESKSVEADEFTEKTLNSFGVERIGDYIHVQRQVFDTLLNEGFFTNTDTRSRIDVNEETGMVIETNKSSIRETFNLSNYERLGKNKKVAKLATVRMIPEAIQKGKLISDNVPNQYENSTNKTFAYISYDTEINGIPVTIKLDVKKTPHKNKLWVHSVFTEKNSTGLDVSFQKGRGGTPYRTDAIGEIIPQENDVVNRDDATSIASPVEKDAEISIAPKVESESEGKTNTKYQLKQYNEHQKENWKNSKRIVLCEGIEHFRQFIRNALTNKDQTNKKMYFGAIPSDLATDIEASTGAKVDGYNLSLAENEIRKIKKSHGNEETEALRGQRAITEDDYLNILNVVQSPDNISLSPKMYEGKPVIEFRKNNGDETSVVAAVVSDKRLDLFVQTTYINKKGGITTPKSVQADSFTPEATGGTASNDIIAENNAAVNTDDATSIAPPVEKDAEISIAPPVDEEGISEEILAIKDRNRAKLTHYKEELKSNIDHRKESWSSYNEQVSSLEKEYAGKKNKNTKVGKYACETHRCFFINFKA